MKPRNEADTKRLPSLVAHIIAEIDRELPGRGREVYWRAWDTWDKNGRETWNKTPATERGTTDARKTKAQLFLDAV